jgi:hypothetical protein
MTSAMRVARRPGNGKQAISASQRSASAKKARPDHKTRKSCIAYSIRMTLPFAIIPPHNLNRFPISICVHTLSSDKKNDRHFINILTQNNRLSHFF